MTALAWVALGSSVASAQARITYSADTALVCGEESELRDLIVARLGYDPFRSDARSPSVTTLSVAVTSAAGVFRASIEVRHDGELIGVRSLQDQTDCSNMLEAVATALAVALEQVRTPAQAPPPAVDDEVPPSLHREEPPRPQTSAEVSSIRLRARAKVGGTPLMFSNFALGGGLGVDARVRDLSMGVDLELRSMIENAQLAGGRRVGLTAVGGTAYVCLRFLPAYVCATGSVLMLDVRRSDTVVRNATAVMGSVGARAGVVAHVTNEFDLFLEADAFALLGFPSLSVGTELAWGPPALGVTVSAGIALSMGD